MTSDHKRITRIEDFFFRHGAGLARHGAVVSSWRWKGSRRLGPYYRLDVRDDAGRKCALYLGREGPLVAAVRARLAQLQHPYRQQQHLDRATRVINRWRRAAYAHLGAELMKFGLRLQGAEVRGFGRLSHALTRAAGPADLAPGQELDRGTSSPITGENEDLVTNFANRATLVRNWKNETLVTNGSNLYYPDMARHVQSLSTPT
jgi:hypothetical protein